MRFAQSLASSIRLDGSAIRVSILSCRRAAVKVCRNVANHGIERNIPGLGFEMSRFLYFVCESKHERATPAWVPTAKCKGAIVIAAAHAESVAAFVKSEEWCDHHIKLSRRDEIAGAGNRFRDAESILAKSLAGFPGTKQQATCAKRVQNGQAEGFTLRADMIGKR